MEQLAMAMTCLLVISGSFLIFLYTPKGKKWLEKQ